MDESTNWKQEYLKDDFAVDKFLSKYIQKRDLETLRMDMKDYAAELHKLMSGILKTETEAIVNLAEHLTNLNSKIVDLTTPILQLHEEIRSLFDVIKSAEKSFEDHFQTVTRINNKQNYLRVKMDIDATSVYVDNIIDNMDEEKQDLAVLERAVNEYSFQNCYMDEMKLVSLRRENNVKEIESKLKAIIDEKFINAVKCNDKHVVVCCLRMYANLNKEEDVERLFMDKILLPVLNKIFTQRNLENSNHDLNALYTKALDVLNNDMRLLQDVLRKNADLRSYNFIINSFWNAVDKLLRENLPDVTAAGNPELFQKRFNDTWRFLEIVASTADNPELIFGQSFQDHLKRFNLAVYFEIRFQQVSGIFESEMMNNLDIQIINAPNDNLQFKLKATSTLWKCMDLCFHPDVFLGHLTDQFTKLSLLVLSRYLLWLENVTGKSSADAQFTETFLVNSLVDLNILRNCIGVSIKDVFDKSIYRIVPKKMWPLMLKIATLNEKTLNDTYQKMQRKLINLKVDQSERKLQQVGAIPRLYRRTNRSVPKEPSNYIREAVDPIAKFYETNNSLLKGVIAPIMDVCILKIGEQYLSLVQEVLHSVCKTEESLRRLKNRTLNSNDDSLQGSSELTSDETKIREQIKLDVEYFTKQLYNFALTDGKNIMKTLGKESGYSV